MKPCTTASQLRFVAIAAALSLSTGCMETGEPISAEEQEAYVLSTSLWLTTTIPVCWENPTSNDETERQWVRDAVYNTWERASAVQFTGWGQCAAGAGGIRIKIQDSGAAVLYLGRFLDGVNSGMRLNFTFNNWSSACRNYGEGVRRACIEENAVHEFGHALGFAHEHNRPDTPSSCTDAPQGTNGDLILGDWDGDSVMNYCNDRQITGQCTTNFPDFWNQTCTYNGPSHHLSAGDWDAVGYVYGTQRFGIDAFLQIAYHDKCMDVESGNPANGTRIQQWDCQSGNSNEIFRLEPFDGHYRIKHVATNKCVDIFDGNTANEAAVYLWDCNTMPWQQFSLVEDTTTLDQRDFLLQARHSGKCLDLQWGSSANGASIHQWPCGLGNPAQQFRMQNF